MAVGFQPTRLTRVQEARWAEKEATQFYAEYRQRLQVDYNYAKEQERLAGDTGLVDTAVDAIERFNKGVPRGQELTNYGASYARWLTNAAKDAAGMPSRALDIPLQQDIRSTFPAAQEEAIR